MIYVVSDLHGYPLDRFRKRLDAAGFGEDDFLYILGDIIDRSGDGGAAMLAWLLEQPNIQLLLGNHEAMLLSCSFVFREITDESIPEMAQAESIGMLSTYLRNGGGVTLAGLKKLAPELREDILDYLRDCPLYEAVTVNGRDFLLVHAGLADFAPEKKLSDYSSDDLLWRSPQPGEDYFPDLMTIVGHTPTYAFGEEYRGRALRTKTWINIDGGAGFGEEPILLRLDDLKEC